MERDLLLRQSSGTAALGICESLLLALVDLKVLDQQAADDLLSDVISTHTGAAPLSSDPDHHLEVVAIVERMRTGMVSTDAR
jgi:hypothetical protein